MNGTDSETQLQDRHPGAPLQSLIERLSLTTIKAARLV